MILALILAGCAIPVSTSVKSELGFGVDLDTSCTGEATLEDSSGTTVYALTLEGETCRVDVHWEGQLADQEAMDAKIEASLEGQPVDRSDVRVAGATLLVTRVELVDAAGNPVQARFPSWEMGLSVAGVSVYEDTGADVPALLRDPLEVELPEEVVAALDASVRDGTPVPGTASASLVLPLEVLPERSGSFTLEVEGDVDIRARVNPL